MSERVTVRHLTAPPLDASTRTRFAPAPSGDLHVGNIRTALYSWALARRHGGTFLLRVEDTDRSRVTDEAFAAALDVLRWMGIDYDEGPDVGGPHAPYRQSERLDVYADAARRLLDDGAAYRCYCTPAELAERREQARREGRPPGYDGRCRNLTDEQRAAFEAEGRTFVLRFRMPDGSTTWLDLVRGEITIDHANVPDFALTRSDGHPLYLLAAGVDDVAMGLTHIVRGEDLVTATPRQLALYAALGHPQERWPAFAHLPLIVGNDNAPLSKRNGEVSIAWYRREGFLPEAMVNYLALLGWSPGGDREFFGVDVLQAEFDLARVSRNPARFDLKKLEAINGDWIRNLSVEDLANRLLPFLEEAS
jgi:glutamyl-tRNA synthetase